MTLLRLVAATSVGSGSKHVPVGAEGPLPGWPSSRWRCQGTLNAGRGLQSCHSTCGVGVGPTWGNPLGRPHPLRVVLPAAMRFAGPYLGPQVGSFPTLTWEPCSHLAERGAVEPAIRDRNAGCG